MFLKIIFSVICILVPGSSFLLSKRTFLAFSIPLIALAWVLLMSYSRWIVSAKGFAIFLIGMLAIHFFSYIAGLILAKYSNKAPVSKKYCIGFFILLVLLNTGITVSSHMYKADWYGFAFYHIPSSSMEPTLYPGDVVFVDTWFYSSEKPRNQEIVVTRKSNDGLVLTKRITNQQFQSGGLELYLEGDNANRSLDSRKFGWVNEKHLIGKVKFIWFSFRRKHRNLRQVR